MALHRGALQTHLRYFPAFQCRQRQTAIALCVGAVENGRVVRPLRTNPIRFSQISQANLDLRNPELWMEYMTMKLVRLFAVAAVIATPFASFAQSNVPATRESVRAELIALQKAGYNPAGDQAQYPRNIEAAEARLHPQDRAVVSSYGAVAAGTSEAGAPKSEAAVLGFDSVYARP
jgi:hypothetical protein